MGYIRYHVIVVTSWSGEAIQKAHRMTKELIVGAEGDWPGLDKGIVQVTEISEITVNGTQSFMVCPDGSNEGWAPSKHGDAIRELIISCFRDFEYEDGSSPLAWAEVQYGDDNGQNIVTKHSGESVACS